MARGGHGGKSEDVRVVDLSCLGQVITCPHVIALGLSLNLHIQQSNTENTSSEKSFEHSDNF